MKTQTIQHTTRVMVWSRIGHTPLTNRTGAFCDLLADVTVQCTTPADAEAAALKLMAETPHASRAHFDMPTFPNQNTRYNWISRNR